MRKDNVSGSELVRFVHESVQFSLELLTDFVLISLECIIEDSSPVPFHFLLVSYNVNFSEDESKLAARCKAKVPATYHNCIDKKEKIPVAEKLQEGDCKAVKPYLIRNVFGRLLQKKTFYSCQCFQFRSLYINFHLPEFINA